MHRVAFTILIAVALVGSASAAEYHVDALRGSDLSGDGSADAPWQTLSRVRPRLQGGDVVILYDGQYGPIDEARTGVTHLYGDWVTYRAADGTAPSVERIQLGWNSEAYVGQTPEGSYDAYLRFEGLHVRDGFSAYGARHWALVNCLVERLGPWTGSVVDLEKAAIAWRGGEDILIQGCEITRTGIGVSGGGRHARIVGNHIHGSTGAAVRLAGLQDSLIEGNHIHDVDDGVAENETPTWSRDGHLIELAVDEAGSWRNAALVFRSNLLYDAKGSAVRLSGPASTDVRNETLVFENNVFGPTRRAMFDAPAPCDGLIFRHNTVLCIPGGRAYHRHTLSDVSLNIGAESTDVEVYNNILGETDIHPAAGLSVFDWNLVQRPGQPRGVGSSRAYGRFTLIGADPRFLGAADLDYQVAVDSPAVGAGTWLFAPDPLYEWDYEGTPRDARPDLGAYEVHGQLPDDEVKPQEFPGRKFVFVDDFEDGHYGDVDPWLAAPGQQGLSWKQSDSADLFYVTQADDAARNGLFEPSRTARGRRTCWIASEQGADWSDYTLEFTAWGSPGASGAGPAVLARDERNCYWLDFTRDGGLVRHLVNGDGRATVERVASSPALCLDAGQSRHYAVTVTHDAQGLLVEVDADADGSVELSYRETEAQALRTFTSGGVAFRGDAPAKAGAVRYDNVSVTLAQVAPQAAAPRLAITAWNVVENHGPAGEIAVPAADGYVVSGLDGLRAAKVAFDAAVDPATVSPKSVSILGTLSGDVSHWVRDVTLSADRRELTITLVAPLPDEDRFVISLADTVAAADGRRLLGNDRRCVLAALAGDVNGTGQVAASDVLQIRENIGRPVTSASSRHDVDGNGTINVVDMLIARARRGHALP
jgi:hypothetical protein